MTATERSCSLDMLRGMTVAGMILVNNAGGSSSWAPLRHSAWNGLTPCDLVFPFFLFIAGVSICLSLRRTGFAHDARTLGRIARRTLLILVIGWALTGLHQLCASGSFPSLHNWRLTGVLPRIALCYGTVALAAVTLPHGWFPAGIAAVLVLYTFVLLSGNGYACDDSNLLAVADRALLGGGHLYAKSCIDPEGILSTLPAIAHTAIGFCCGRIFVDAGRSQNERLLRLFATGTLLLAAGWLLAAGLPVNKRIWSPSFVLVTCGAAALLLATLSSRIDRNGTPKRRSLLLAYGVNPLLLYIVAEVLAALADGSGLRQRIYDGLFRILPDACAASACYALLFTLLLGALGVWLRQRKIFVKL